MTILDWCRIQDRGVLPKEVNKAFPERTARQISDSLRDYVQRGKMERILIPSAGRRYRYKVAKKERVVLEYFGKSEVKPEALPLVRIP